MRAVTFERERVGGGVNKHWVYNLEDAIAVLDISGIVIVVFVLKFLEVGQTVHQRFNQNDYLTFWKVHPTVVTRFNYFRYCLGTSFHEL